MANPTGINQYSKGGGGKRKTQKQKKQLPPIKRFVVGASVTGTPTKPGGLRRMLGYT